MSAKHQIKMASVQARPALKAALLQVGTLSECGNFIELTTEQLAGLGRTPVQSVSTLTDRVELGLCGKHREAWVSAGRPLRAEPQVETLRSICAGCDHLLRGIRCREHHCTHAGRRAATYDCPLGKWAGVALATA